MESTNGSIHHSPLPWTIYPQPVADRDEAKHELATLVDGTPVFTPVLYMIESDGLAPAITGCGALSEANAQFIVTAVNSHAALVSAVESALRKHRAEQDLLTSNEVYMPPLVEHKLAQFEQMLVAALAGVSGALAEATFSMQQSDL